MNMDVFIDYLNSYWRELILPISIGIFGLVLGLLVFRGFRMAEKSSQVSIRTKVIPDSAPIERSSVPTLVITNLVPILGVLFADWDVSLVLLVYWLEIFIIYIWMVLDVAVIFMMGYIYTFKNKPQVNPEYDRVVLANKQNPIVGLIEMFFSLSLLLIFSSVLLSVFSNFSGAAIVYMLTGDKVVVLTNDYFFNPFNPLDTMELAILVIPMFGLKLAVLVLFVSYGIQYISYFFITDIKIMNKMRLKILDRSANELTKRVFLMLIVAMLLGFVQIQPSLSIWILVILIALKITLDVSDHIKSYRSIHVST